MRFKKLQLLGFKSFVESTELVFEPGITAIVGPNGCGKCLAFSQEVPTADGQCWKIGELVEATLQKANRTFLLDDGFFTTDNPFKIFILSLNPTTLKLEPKPVGAFVKRTTPSFLLRIWTQSGRHVIATPYHPLFAWKEGRIVPLRADEVKVGIEVAVASNRVSLGLKTLAGIPRTSDVQAMAAGPSYSQSPLPFAQCNPTLVCQDPDGWADSDIEWDEVVAVEKIPPCGEWVYDLSIEETHNFLAQGMVVHNSNIADAIKWVLGEQSARELRGGRMEDLIFNGSEFRQPVHFAEVSLTIDNAEGKLPTEYTEVQITRRLFRSGESEYLLNRTPVRLKDIQTLLSGTGLGVSAYSLFEQGRIEQILNARPEDRRAVFEEAAGITKFKAQKKEAMRRLEETEENLTRLGDILAEVKRQIQALERQVHRAKVYQEHWQELKRLEAILARYKIQILDRHGEEKAQRMEMLKAEEAQLEARLKEKEAQWQQVRQMVAQSEEALSLTKERWLSALHRRQSIQNQLEMTRERLAEGKDRMKELQREIEQAEQQLAQMRLKRQALMRQMEEQSVQSQTIQTHIAQCEDRLAACIQKAQELQRQVEETQAKILDLTARSVQAKNHVTKLRQESARWEARSSRLESEIEKVTTEQRQTAQRVASLSQDLMERRTLLEDLKKQRQLCQENLKATETSLKELQCEVHRLEQEQTRWASQIEVLKGWVASHEGYSVGVKALLKALDEGSLERAGIVGPLAELIEVRSDDAVAVDAALGPWVEAVVVDSFQVAERCRKFLEETQAGRVLFLMKDRLPHKSPTVGSTHSNGCIPLIQRVGITPHLAPILDFLLADTWLAPNREEAIAFLHKQNGQTSMRVVTPEGELITSTSAWLGGRVGQEHLVIGRIGRLQTLEVALAHVEEQLAEVRERLTSGQTQRQTQWETLQTLEDRIRQEQEAIHGIQAHLDSAQAEEDRLARELDLLHAERLEASQELEGLRTQLNRAEAEQADWDRQVAEAEAALNGYRETIAQTLRTREAISIELAEARAKWASLEQVVQSRKSSWTVLEESMGSLEGRIAREREELGEWEQKEVQWQKDCMDLEQELGRMETSIENMKGHLEEAKRHRAQAIEAAQVEEEACSVERQRLEQLRERLHAEAMEQAQTAFEKEQIFTRMQQLYGMEWKDIEQVDVQETAQADGSYPEADMDAMRTRIEELSRTIQRMGPVNLGSIEEEQELKARYEYLVAQRDDLVKARQDLHEALTKINRTARAMFRETFQAIQKEFQVAFKELFGGGEARLTLIDEEDVLESGIEIIARPPGKPLQPISLLSGGEKALTTIALLFAIFRIKPSPFCLMDEIDAPLDEANIDRFTRALKGFLKDSQFVIITHNKKTISMADLVYGITMEERGVSKLVSVKFKEKASENGLSSNGNGFKESGEIASDPTRSLPDPRSPAPSPPATA